MQADRIGGDSVEPPSPLAMSCQNEHRRYGLLQARNADGKVAPEGAYAVYDLNYGLAVRDLAPPSHS